MSNLEIDEFGHKFWFNDKGQFHRLDGPAIEYASGDNYWYVNDELHRLDGPACERTNGTKEWWVNGKYHRLDGPAVELPSGTKYWYANGNYLSGPLGLIGHGANWKDLVEWMTPREIALCRTQK